MRGVGGLDLTEWAAQDGYLENFLAPYITLARLLTKFSGLPAYGGH